MSTIHQIYCTHCTHGSSALERREGELAHRMLGYSARAGSADANELRRYYRQVERYAYYYLPRDTPADEKLRLTAATAPRRLVYVPSTGGLQMVGQVCYRPTDTEGRPGSYFAHVLFRDERDGQTPWSALDCLRLWGAAGWVGEDSPDIPFLLRPLGSLAEVLAGSPPILGDELLLSFLTLPAGGSFYDPGGVVPPRWRQKEPAQRRQLFLEVLSGVLEVSPQQRAALLLAVEPSMAALLFYGALRLLPGGQVRDGLSFSTFEPNPDRLCTTLAATWFYDPDKADLRPDAFRSRGLAINTVGDRRFENPRPPSRYALCVVERLLAEGWAAVDRTLAVFQSCGARSAEDLEGLAAIDRLVPALLEGRDLPAAEDWRKSPMAVSYLRRALAQELAKRPDAAAALQPLVGQPAHLLALELLTGDAELPATRPAVEYLLQRLAEPHIAAFIQLAGTPPEYKVAVLSRYVTAYKDLPLGCEPLWDEAECSAGTRLTGATGCSSARAVALLPQVLARLDSQTVQDFFRKADERRRLTFLASLIEARRAAAPAAGGTGGSSASALTAIVRSQDSSVLFELHRQYGDDFFRQYPQDEPALAEKLHELLGTLPDPIERFSERLDVLLAGEHLLPTDQDQHAAGGWGKCRRAILEIGPLQGQATGLLRSRPTVELEIACRQMAEGIARALPKEVLEDDPKGTKKQEHLRRVAGCLLDGAELLPKSTWQCEALWRKIASFFESGKWPAGRLMKVRAKTSPRGTRRSKRRSPKSLWVVLGGVAVILAAAIAVGPWVVSAVRGTPQAAQSEAGKAAPNKQLAASGAAAKTAKDKAARDKAAADKTLAEKAKRDLAEAAKAKQQADEAEEARMAAEETARQKKEQEAIEQAAADKAEAERLAREREQAEALAKVDREKRWRANAVQFALQRRGALLEQRLLVAAMARLPDLGGAATDPPQVYLGAGRLHLDDGVFPFGEGFEQSAPVTRHEIPEAAEKFGYAAVSVEIQRRPEGFCLVTKAEPRAPALDGVAEQKVETERLKGTRQMLMAQLTRWRDMEKMPDSQSKDTLQKELRGMLVRLAGIEIPGGPAPPDPKDPRYVADPAAYGKAVAAYNSAVKAHNDAVEHIADSARQRIAAITGRIDQITAETRQQQSKARLEAERAKEQWKARCRAITAIVYQDAGASKAVGDASPQPLAPAPPSPAGPPAAKAGKEVRGEIKLETGEITSRLDPGVMARARIQVTPAPGAAMPAWLKANYVVNCVVREYAAAGQPRTFTVIEVFVPKTYPILDGTGKIEVQFEFVRSADDLPGAERTTVARSPWYPVPVQRGKEYAVRFQLTKEALDQLRTPSN